MHSFGGGAEKVALDLVRHLVGMGHDVTVGSLWWIPRLKDALSISPDVMTIMPQHPGMLPAMTNLLAIRRAAHRSDAVLGSLELQSILAAALAAPGRAIAWIHKDVSGYLDTKGSLRRLLYKTLLRYALLRSRVVVCVSEGATASLQRLLPEIAARCRTIYNPMDIDAIRMASRKELPNRLAEILQRPTILAVGRLEAEKAFHLLLQAHVILRLRGIDCDVCILGEGSLRPVLEDAVHTLGLDGRAHFPGHVENPYPAMRKAAVLALTSVFEGSPCVLVEALALNVPIVATDCPSGPREVLADGRLGRLIPMGDALILADALENAMGSGSVKDAATGEDAQMDAVRMSALRRFAPDTILEAWERLLAESTAILPEGMPVWPVHCRRGFAKTVRIPDRGAA
jgi:glycosyltransferase involved in cell wall biosynthesis